jgi:hypothetical protein
MAFEYAYSLDGMAVSSIKDFPLDTVTNYQNGVGTNGYKKGDLVYLNGGLVTRTKNQATPKAVGVLEGIAFTGLVAQGQPYAAVNSSFTSSSTDMTRNPNGIGKIRVETDSVYRVPVAAGKIATNANVGVAYGISQDATGDQTVDITNVANPVVKVVDISKDGTKVFVIMATNNTF